jgi:hypothetical protein
MSMNLPISQFIKSLESDLQARPIHVKCFTESFCDSRIKTAAKKCLIYKQISPFH